MTRPNTRRLLALALASALSLPAWAQTAITPFKVADIRVDGLQRIAAGTVFTYLPIERGDTVDQAKIAAAIRALYKTGFFEDVSMSEQGDVLVVNVVERPAINKLTLTGNKDLKTDDLMKGLKEIGLAEGDTYDPLSLDRVTQELTRQYNNRGKYNVRITPTVSRLDRNRVDITIAINEGKAVEIQHINIVGTGAFTDKQVLDNWELRPHNWLSWYRRDDQYSREKLGGDLEKLNSFYLDRGYIDFALNSTQVEIDDSKRDMFITAGITEGEPYTISKVELAGDTVLPKADVEKMVLTRPGMVFSRRVLEASSDLIIGALSNIGYAFAQVNPIPQVDREKHTVALTLQVVPGPRVLVRRIIFKGNNRTADAVLRRQMRQFENAWYSQAAIDRSKIRLQQLGFFESVDVENRPVPGSPDQVDVVYNVKETTSGSFQFGVGFSQLTGITTSIQLSQSNFLGTGNTLAVEAQNNVFSKRYSFSFVNPYFTEDGMSLGYNIWRRELDNSNFNIAAFNTTSTAGQVVLGLPISETDTVSAMFGVDSNQIFVFPGSSPQSFVDYVDAVGKRTFHSWRAQFGWSRDTRNDFFTPSAGTLQQVGLEMTLPGSTAQYYKLSYLFSRYWPISRWLVLNTRADLGYGDSYGKAFERDVFIGSSYPLVHLKASGLPFFENFYAGGTRSVRGYRDNTLGPREFVGLLDTFGQPVGGAFKTVGSVEAFFPGLLDSPSARVSAFFDFGNVYARPKDFNASELRGSVGVALLWRAPVGPISISFAFPLNKKPGDQVERLQFTFGGAF